MKRSIFMLALFLLCVGAATLFPCDVTMEAKPADGKGRIQVRLYVDCVHRFCPLAIEKTQLQAEGLTIEKKGEWNRIEKNLYGLDLVVSLKGKSGGTINVIRSCPKRGLQKETVTIDPL